MKGNPRNRSTPRESIDEMRGRGSLHRSHLQTLVVAIASIGFFACAGCSIRYDAAGVTRVGIGLWGFGDPPGVQWNLDQPHRETPELPRAPRREAPELPAAPRPELPPRTMSDNRSSDDARAELPRPDVFDQTGMPIKDNHACASRGLTDIACHLALRAFARGPDRARG